jgi:hypothetical protein
VKIDFARARIRHTIKSQGLNAYEPTSIIDYDDYGMDNYKPDNLEERDILQLSSLNGIYYSSGNEKIPHGHDCDMSTPTFFSAVQMQLSDQKEKEFDIPMRSTASVAIHYDLNDETPSQVKVLLESCTSKRRRSVYPTGKSFL